MLDRSQPLDPAVAEKMGLNAEAEAEERDERVIQSQRIGEMFDDLLLDDRKTKIDWKTRLKWRRRRFHEKYNDFRFALRNYRRWRKTVGQLRPWAGFDGLIGVMQTHLRDYIALEEKHGRSLAEFKERKIAAARETVDILERMRDPQEYTNRRRGAVEAKYPKYKTLITEYKNGGVGISGDFVAQGGGWTGKEAGSDPREGYFEFVDGRFELAASPDQDETDRLLAEHREYEEEIENAYRQAEADSDADFDRLSELWKEHFYSWWD